MSAPVTITAAEKLAATVGGVVGYRYDNPNVSGEFRAPDAASVSQFVSKFRLDFSTDPQITGLIVEREVDPDTGELLDPPSPLTVKAAPFTAEETPAEDLEQFRDAPIASEPQADFGRFFGDEWRPEVVDTEIIKMQPYVEFTQRLQWGAYSSPTNIPENYGMEAGVDLYNENGGWITPFCPIGNEAQFFATRDAWADVQVITFGEATGPLQVYQDSTVADDCWRAAFTLGMRYPQNIPADEDGNYALTIRITADEGDMAENRMGSDVTLLDDTKCRDEESAGYQANLPLCMGYSQIEPEGVEVGRNVLSQERGWMGPNRCWRSADYGFDRALPLATCGQEPLARPALAANIIEVTTPMMAGQSRSLTIQQELPILLVRQPPIHGSPTLRKSIGRPTALSPTCAFGSMASSALWMPTGGI